MEVGSEINVVCVVHLNQNVAGLRCDLEKPLLEVVMGLIVLLVGSRATQVNVIPESWRHFI